MVGNRKGRVVFVTMARQMVVLMLVSQLLVVRGNVDVMKDVTLGFGEALQHCREEVSKTRI